MPAPPFRCCFAFFSDLRTPISAEQLNLYTNMLCFNNIALFKLNCIIRVKGDFMFNKFTSPCRRSIKVLSTGCQLSSCSNGGCLISTKMAMAKLSQLLKCY